MGLQKALNYYAQLLRRDKSNASFRRGRGKNLSLADRRRAAISRGETERSIYDDVRAFWNRRDAEVEAIAARHKKKKAWVESVVNRRGNLSKKTRKVNPHNAWLHVMSLKINDGKCHLWRHEGCANNIKGLEPGERTRLTDLKAKAQAVDDYDKLDKHALQEMMHLLEEWRESKKAGVRSAGRGHALEVRHSTNAINTEVSQHLHHRSILS
jgi:hypothetical protein